MKIEWLIDTHKEQHSGQERGREGEERREEREKEGYRISLSQYRVLAMKIKQ